MEDGSYAPKEPHKYENFQIKDVIGKGSYGHVHEGVKERNQQEVVIKHAKLSQEAAVASEKPLHEQHADAQDRLLKEARTLAKLEHPHIVPVLDVYKEENGDITLVMKKVGNENLDQYRKEHPLKTPDKVKIIKQVASAVDYVNEHGVLHRDIKPTNIQIEDGNAFLSDFGTSSAVLEQPADFVIGPPPFMSPEQAQHHDKPGDSEEYAVALLAFTLLTDKTVYELTPAQQTEKGANIHESKLKEVATRNGLPTAAKELLLNKYKHNETAALGVAAVFDKALALKKEDRYHNASEFAAALENAMRLRN